MKYITVSKFKAGKEEKFMITRIFNNEKEFKNYLMNNLPYRYFVVNELVHPEINLIKSGKTVSKMYFIDKQTMYL